MGITCKKAVDFISKKEEGKLSLIQQSQLLWHLAICYVCKRFKNQNSLIISTLKKQHSSETSDQRLNPVEKQKMIQLLEENI